MKSIKLIIAAVLVMVGMSVMGQWTDNGTYTHTTDAIGIGYTSNPDPSLRIGLAVAGDIYTGDRLFLGGNMKPTKTSERWDFGWGALFGANVEFYSSRHITNPGEMRFIFGGVGFGNINYKHYNGSSYDSYLFINHDGNIGIGTETPSEKLSVNGNISANALAINGKITSKEVEVTLVGWPDYVFEDDYALKPLEQVEDFIKINKHLPGVPNEKEISENGVNLGEMNKILMEKVEELTLYVIELNKKIEDLENK